MLFEGYGHVPEVTTPCTLLNADNPRIEMSNYRGFTEKIPGDAIVGEATEVQVVEPVSDEIQTEVLVKMVTSDQKCGRQQKLTEKVQVTSLCEPERTLLLNLLKDYHDIFALEESDRGETDLIQLEVDTGDVTPIKQPTRRMPFAAQTL